MKPVLPALLFAMTASLTIAAPAPSNSWRTLAPLPDPIGWAGMFAGVLDGRLVIGGGSHFPKNPPWLQGAKEFNDRLWALAAPAGRWEELPLRLPEKSGNAAFAATDDAICVVGGIAADGFRAGAAKLSCAAGTWQWTPLPALPRPLGYAAAAIADGRIYVVGGQHAPTDKAATAETWSLGLAPAEAAWRREPDLPGPGVFVPGVAEDRGGFLVLGGMAFTADGALAPSAAVYRFDAARRAWEHLPDLPEPRVAPASPCPRLPDGRILVIGGYAQVFPGAAREHPGFSAQTLVFDPSARRWSDGPVLPRAPVGDRDVTTDAGPTPMVGAPVVAWRELAVVVGGETRPATRTNTVVAWPLDRGAGP